MDARSRRIGFRVSASDHRSTLDSVADPVRRSLERCSDRGLGLSTGSTERPAGTDGSLFSTVV
ncbi:hypothetical protein C488_16909 [Natrinema pellirubrum DSM 15624]|uniref:Uncharacterized protein n=1 Tax=Natrinema pellirubrum (strain DSM 15624 / CIP 106293 / JCM 10476 / NCIMB 786 / 157) TaxID=797303 RepID=L9YDC2_NATP1|nr:hypothetical protein C488_16909 [Natrinema pellirubrum DSM 15624]